MNESQITIRSESSVGGIGSERYITILLVAKGDTQPRPVARYLFPHFRERSNANLDGRAHLQDFNFCAIKDVRRQLGNIVHRQRSIMPSPNNQLINQ